MSRMARTTVTRIKRRIDREKIYARRLHAAPPGALAAADVDVDERLRNWPVSFYRSPRPRRAFVFNQSSPWGRVRSVRPPRRIVNRATGVPASLPHFASSVFGNACTIDRGVLRETVSEEREQHAARYLARHRRGSSGTRSN